MWRILSSVFGHIVFAIIVWNFWFNLEQYVLIVLSILFEMISYPHNKNFVWNKFSDREQWPSSYVAGIPIQRFPVRIHASPLQGWTSCSSFRGWWNEYQFFTGDYVIKVTCLLLVGWGFVLREMNAFHIQKMSIMLYKVFWGKNIFSDR